MWRLLRAWQSLRSVTPRERGAGTPFQVTGMRACHSVCVVPIERVRDVCTLRMTCHHSDHRQPDAGV